jgi:hypothetical protein
MLIWYIFREYTEPARVSGGSLLPHAALYLNSGGGGGMKYPMTIEQTVDIPPDHRLTIEVPKEIPTGETRVIIQFPTPAAQVRDPSGADIDLPPSYAPEEAIKIATQRLADPNRKLPSSYIGILPGYFGGDGVAYQRKLRDEWDD